MQAPPDAVLGAVRDALATGHQGNPARRRPRGAQGARGRVRGYGFTVWISGGPEGDGTRLSGTVHPVEGGGSDVRASVLARQGAATDVLVALGMAVVAVIAGIQRNWLIAGFAAASGIVAAVRRAAGAMNHDEAAFLREWVNAVLDRVEAPGAAPSANDRARPGIPE